MLHDRWGAAARAILGSITNYNPKSLVLKLSEYENLGFICEYVGYLLLTEHNVNLEELLLEAEQQEMFDKIAPFVSPNLQYESEFYDGHLHDILEALNRHTDSNYFITVISSYSQHITNLGAQDIAAKLLGDLKGKAELSFMHAIAPPWFENDRKQAGEVIGRLLAYPGIWSGKAALDFLEVSLSEDEAEFLCYYPQIERLIQTDRELWLTAIPVFTRYILDYDCTSENEETYQAVLSLLQKIPDGSLDERRSFLSALQWKPINKESIEMIFRAIIRRPFEKDSSVLNVLNNLLYFSVQENQCDISPFLHTLAEVFSSSGFSADYAYFFKGFSYVTYYLAKQFSSQAAAFALNYILEGGTDRLFFGLGLLTEAGNLPKLFYERTAQSIDFPAHLTSDQLIYITKGLLYFTFDSNMACRTVFQLLLFASESDEGFIQFCLNEVFAHYPGTMHDMAKQFKENGTNLQIRLAEQVKRAYQQSADEYAVSLEIKDFAPSQEHQRIFQQAQAKLTQKAEENCESSFFQDLFPTRMLKYGAKLAWVIHGRKGHLSFNVSPPAHIAHRMELSAEYVTDPIQFEVKRRIFLKEVHDRAAGDQGLPATVEREG